jgi:hypothetical protein
LLYFPFAKAQAQDSLRTEVDSTAIVKHHSPRTATLCSTFLPGLGQAYNGKAWKIPIIYAGFAGLVYSYQFNNTHYQDFRREFNNRNHGIKTVKYSLYSDANIKDAKDYYRRYRDMTVIGFLALYVANIVDATVDGYFYEYDISDDLSMKIGPAFVPSDYYISNVGLTLRFNF